MDFAAFSRAIERRYSAVNNQLSTLQAMTSVAVSCAGLHGECPEHRGLEGRNAAIARLSGWRPQDALKNSAKIGSTQQTTSLIGSSGTAFVSDLQYARNPVQKQKFDGNMSIESTRRNLTGGTFYQFLPIRVFRP
jgi:hypothetical protein